MTKRSFFILAVVIGWFCHDGAHGQTAINVSQVSCTISTTPVVVVAIPSPGGRAARLICAPLDPAFKLDTTTNPPTLRFVGSAFSDQETPIGAIDGVNLKYVLNLTPVAGSLYVYLNGLLQQAGPDYTLTGNIVTFVTAPNVGDSVRMSYRR